MYIRLELLSFECDKPNVIVSHSQMCLSYTVEGSVPFGLALFDAEYDRWSKKGNKTANFPLTRSARKALDDIKHDSAASSNGSMKCVTSE
ncbi:hypothetical protein HPB50_020907 [Hyalomma asiaticum]|uniref:Uncharacterized protein n=1 Tax=Hyalomma asiaticum TaxID=266040 RepID=A0ACB7SPB9_HYAAI|nr:hypothetical protein HPB50_020907 [Hyalomma asiaticum]